MKTKLRILALAVSLGLPLSFPVARAEAVAVGGSPPPVLDASLSYLRELQRAIDPKLPLRTGFERLETFQPTPATAAKLRGVFGTDHPLLFARQPDQGGRMRWRATLVPLHYESAPGSGVDWDEASADFTLDKSGAVLDIAGTWKRFSASDGQTRITENGMTVSGHQKRGFGGVWYGSGQAHIASVRLENGQGGPVLIEDLSSKASTVEHPKSADMTYENRIGAISAAGQRIEDLHVGIRVLNIDKQVLAEFKAANEKRAQAAQSAPTTPPTPAQQLDAIKPLLRDFGRSAIARGTTVEIDDISARYHGNTASVRGRVGLAGAKPADLDDLKLLAKRIVASIEIKVPLAIVRDIAGAVAVQQARQAAAAHAAQQGNAAPAAPPQPNAQMGQTIADLIVGKLVGGGFARVENDTLVSNLEWRNGALRANGKPVPLPAVPQRASMPLSSSASSETVAANGNAPVPAMPLPDNALQARLVDGSCRLPDFPDEVVRKDQVLQMALTYRVDSAGKVANAAIAAPSRFPAWDQAALAALAQCTYIPALKDGQPFALPMLWVIRREPGSTHP